MNKRFTIVLRIGLSLVLLVAPLLPTVSGRNRVLSSNRLAGRKPVSPNPEPGRLPAPKLKASKTSTKQDMPKVVGQSATLLADGRWLLVGGDGDSMSTASIFDPETGYTNSLRSGPLNPRMAHSATVLPNGTVLILGGIGASGRYIDTAEIFNPETETFETFAATGLAPRAHHTATLLTNGQILVAGGTDARAKLSTRVELFDPQRKTTSVVATKLPSGRNKHIAALQKDGTVLFSGGVDTNGNSRSDGEVYDPESQTFVSTIVPASKQDENIPRLEFSSPANGSLEVDENTVIVLRFSKPLAVKSLNRQSAVLEGPGGAVPARVIPAEAGMLAFITPLAPLAAGTNYNLTISGGTDRDSRPLPFVALSFKTKECSGSACENTRDTRSPIDLDSWIPDANNLNGDWRSKRPGSQAQSLPALQAPAGQTALSGQVLTLSGNPLANVTLQIGDEIARTDHTGRFLLLNPTPGRPVLTIQGHTASRPGKTYGTFDVIVDVKAGKTTVLPYTIWLPVLDDQNAAALPIPTAREISVTTPRVPGMEVRIPSDAVMRLPGGKHHMHGMAKRELTSMAITPIPIDRPPFPLPPGVSDGLLFTLQLHGAKVEGLHGEKRPGLRIVFPNYAQLPARSRVDFWNYDAEAGTGWYLYGRGTVTADGRQVVPDPGVELQSMQCISLMDKGLVGDGPAACGGCADGDPVDLGTGLFVDTKVDLALPDVIPISLSRTYRQKDSTGRSFGKGATNPYDMFILGDTFNYGEIVLPDLGRIRFNRIPNSNPAVYEHTSTPTRFYKATMKMIGGVGPNGAWEVKLTDGTVYQFGIKVLWGDIFGPHLTITGLSVVQDRYGHKLVVLRDSDFRMSKVISPNGRWIEFTYIDNSKRIAQAKDNIGRTVNYTYDANGRLWKVTDPAGGVTEYTYDASDRMLTIKDARGIVYLTNVYDPTSGRVTQQTLADGAVYQFAYTVNGSGKIIQTDVTDPRGDVRRVTFNAAGYSLTDTRALGKPEEQSVVYERDATNNYLTSVTDPLGRVTTYQRNAQASITSVTRMSGTAAAATINYTYDPVFNQLTSFSDPLGHVTTVTYDRWGNPTRITDALGHQTNITYNKSGQPVSVTDALGHTYLFIYHLGDLVELRDPLGRRFTRALDGAGRVSRMTNALGQSTRYEYNTLNQVTSVTDALGGITGFSYDANGNLLSMTDARGGITSYTYNNMDRVITRMDPLQGATSTENYEYDLMGNLAKLTDRRGKVATFGYDGIQRTKFIGYGTIGSGPGATYESTTQYSYDDANRLTQAVDSQSGNIVRVYDDLARTMSETTPNGTVTHTFDAAARKTAMEVAGQSAISYSYDDADQLLSVAQGTATVTFGYDNANRRTSVTLPNGVVMAYAYDAASQLTGLTYTHGSNVLGNLTYGYDDAGRRTSLGGSLARSTSPATVSTVSHNAANQQTSFGGQSLTHDANGNLLTDGSNTYTWNARNQLVGITGSITASFGYDALGRRTSKTINGTTTGYLYAGENVVQELSGSTAIANLLTGRTDEVFSRSDEFGLSNFLTDGIGSTLALTDSSGATQTEYAYDAFGKTAGSGVTNRNPSQFNNRENDQTSLYYYRARYYSPDRQRFISEDPFGIQAGPNSYTYVNNDPLNFRDPSGKIPLFVITAAIGAIAGGVGVIVGKGFTNLACGRGFFDGADSAGYWGDVALGAGSGAVNGALLATPLGATRAGAALLGAGTNMGQYGLSVLAGRSCGSLGGLLISGATGAAGGLIGGPVKPAAPWGPQNFAPEISPNIGRGVIEGSNNLANIAANAGPSNMLRTTLGGMASNGPWSLCGC